MRIERIENVLGDRDELSGFFIDQADQLEYLNVVGEIFNVV